MGGVRNLTFTFYPHANLHSRVVSTNQKGALGRRPSAHAVSGGSYTVTWNTTTEPADLRLARRLDPTASLSVSRWWATAHGKYGGVSCTGPDRGCIRSATPPVPLERRLAPLECLPLQCLPPIGTPQIRSCLLDEGLGENSFNLARQKSVLAKLISSTRLRIWPRQRGFVKSP